MQIHGVESHLEQRSSVMKKETVFCIFENKDTVTVQQISVFVFASWIVHSVFLCPKFQASSLFLRLFRQDHCVGLGWKPEDFFFVKQPIFYCVASCVIQYIYIHL